MPPRPDAEARPPSWLTVLWPAFVMAGVLEAMTFAVLDPMGLTGFDGQPFGWSRQAVYSVTFLIYWGAIAAACAATRWLDNRG